MSDGRQHWTPNHAVGCVRYLRWSDVKLSCRELTFQGQQLQQTVAWQWQLLGCCCCLHQLQVMDRLQLQGLHKQTQELVESPAISENVLTAVIELQKNKCGGPAYSGFHVIRTKNGNDAIFRWETFTPGSFLHPLAGLIPSNLRTTPSPGLFSW